MKDHDNVSSAMSTYYSKQVSMYSLTTLHNIYVQCDLIINIDKIITCIVYIISL